MDYDKLVASLDKYLVKKGTESIDKDITQFKVTLVEIVKDEKYALVVAMSHVIGDGHTFYSVYSMLDMNTSPTALTVERKQCFMDRLQASSGKKFLDWLTSPVLIYGVLGNLLLRKKTSIAIFDVNIEKIQEIKGNYLLSRKESSPPFISTNDILTSWFFRLCGNKYNMMTVNFRNRYSGYSDALVGTYEGLILYTRGDCSTPQDIRESLTTFQGKSETIPSVLDTLDFDVSMVTNWSTFYSDVCLSVDSKSVLHLPIQKASDVAMRDVCVVFNSSKDRLSMLCGCRSVPPSVFANSMDTLLRIQD